jgi:hypothetical protein
MEWALRWFDTVDDFALAARAWWTRGDSTSRLAVLLAASILALLLLP